MILLREAPAAGAVEALVDFLDDPEDVEAVVALREEEEDWDCFFSRVGERERRDDLERVRSLLVLRLRLLLLCLRERGLALRELYTSHANITFIFKHKQGGRIIVRQCAEKNEKKGEYRRG